tara:strand:- start:25822 stop:26316 length:495 start_codon:yes stop_codon:yes gene_type:complete
MKRSKNILRPPLKSWDVYTMHLLVEAQKFYKQSEIKILKNYQKKFNWDLDVESLLLNNEFDVIVLTNLNQEIQWVNNGFKKMTGYPANYAKGKKPNFLQGEKSSETTIKRIRKNLKKGIHFKETVINYRKNGEIYNCAIEIYPLKDGNNNIQHLLALETEIKLV